MKIKRSTDVATYLFLSSNEAWRFLHECNSAKLMAGYPSLLGPYTVEVGIATDSDRDTADDLSKGAPVIGYEFAGSEYDL